MASGSSYDAPTAAAAQERSGRICTRRYALTKSEHKYLEIGLCVGPPCFVEIAIGDKKGHELRLSPEAWNGLVGKQDIIQEYFAKDVNSAKPLLIGPMVMTLVEYLNKKCICLELNQIYITMTAPTLYRMFSLDRCINHMQNWLTTCMHTVDYKFHQFNSLVYSILNRKDAIACIEASECFDETQSIDCELLAAF